MKDQNSESARDRILERLNFHVNRLETPDRLPKLPRWGIESLEERTAHFKDELTAAGTKVWRIDPQNIIFAIARLVTQQNTRGLLMGSGGWEQHSELQSLLTNQSIAFESWNENSNPQVYTSHWSAIAYAYAAIAETASLVLWHDAQQPQVISTAAFHLIVLIKQSVIKNQFLDLAEGAEWAYPPPSLSIITGTGRYSVLGTDSMLEGLGPKMVDVIIINDAPAPSSDAQEPGKPVAPHLTLQ